MSKTLEYGGESSMKVAAWLFHVQCIVRVLSIAMGFFCQFGESNLLFWQQPGLFGDSLWPTTLIYNLIPVLETSLGNKRYLLGFCLHYLKISVRLPKICIYFRKLVLYY